MDSPQSDPAPELDAAFASALAKTHGRIGLAVSGGPDSVAMLVVAARSPLASRGLIALHVNHGLRAESDHDADIARRAAERLGIAFREAHVDPSSRRPGGSSLEARARSHRYAALAGFAEAEDLGAVVVAHSRDDQAETRLLALLRGAWPQALIGMPRQRPLTPRCVLVRPFLESSRDRLRSAASALEVAHDQSNDDLAHRRNAVRNVLIPALNVSGTGALLTLSDLGAAAARLHTAARDRARTFLAGIPERANPRICEFPTAALVALGRFARLELWRVVFASESEFGGAPTWRIAQDIEQALKAGGPRSFEIRRGLRVSISPRWVRLGPSDVV